MSIFSKDLTDAEKGKLLFENHIKHVLDEYLDKKLDEIVAQKIDKFKAAAIDTANQVIGKEMDSLIDNLESVKESMSTKLKRSTTSIINDFDERVEAEKKWFSSLSEKFEKHNTNVEKSIDLYAKVTSAIDSLSKTYVDELKYAKQELLNTVVIANNNIAASKFLAEWDGKLIDPKSGDNPLDTYLEVQKKLLEPFSDKLSDVRGNK